MDRRRRAGVLVASVVTPGGGLGPRRRTAGIGLVLLGLPLFTALLVAVGPALALESVLLLYLLAVVVVAVVGGVLPAVLAAVTSFLLANWFLTPPFRTLLVASTDEVIDLVVFLLVALTVSVTVDVSARRRVVAERRLAEQDARARELVEVDRLRTALLVAVGHDLRTPLAGAKAAVSVLREQGIELSGQDRAALLGAVEESVDRLGELVADLLDLSRLEAGAVVVRRDPVAIDAVVARALLGVVPHGLGGDVIRNEVPDDLPRALVDAGLLERVLANLVDNAVRHRRPGSTVDVTAAFIDDAVEVSVADRGPGVPEAQWERMFVPFQRLDDAGHGTGLGLGLAIARGFTDAMGGSLVPSATPGGGLTMTVRVPLADVDRPAMGRPTAERPR